jgi:hypothetical protein
MTKPRQPDQPPSGGGRRVATYRELLSSLSPGDMSKLATMIGAPLSTVSAWKRRDSIPVEWHASVARAARELGARQINAAALKRLADLRGEEHRLSRAGRPWL